MDDSLIIILAIILLILVILNNITVVRPTTRQAKCSQTEFGCCSNGFDSKVNYYGTNCPGYRPAPSPTPSKPIGGCSGTRYGCCPNNSTAKINPQGSNCVVPN